MNADAQGRAGTYPRLMGWEPITTAEQLVNAHERSTFDAKETYDLNKPGVKFEIAKDVAAFASVSGGSLVIGAVENKGHLVKLPGIPDVPIMIRAVSDAVSQFCHPNPYYSDERLDVDEETKERILGRPATGTAQLLVINVAPTLSAPIGVLACDASGKALANAYRFPVRVGDRTDYLRPEELPMLMNSHERRVWIQLSEIPGVARGAPADVWLFDRRMAEGSGVRRPYVVKSVDMRRLAVTLAYRTGSTPAAVVPLTFIRAVWHQDDEFFIAVDGFVHSREGTPFEPGGRAW
jgi:hypothetical protein